jgi:ABC-2 type transport system ATP-binding protein
VLELRNLHDATIIITTHDMGEAEALCERIAILDEGRIVAEDTPQGLKGRVPASNGHEPTLEEVFMELTGKQLIGDDENHPAEQPSAVAERVADLEPAMD